MLFSQNGIFWGFPAEARTHSWLRAFEPHMEPHGVSWSHIKAHSGPDAVVRSRTTRQHMYQAGWCSVLTASLCEACHKQLSKVNFRVFGTLVRKEWRCIAFQLSTSDCPIGLLCLRQPEILAVFGLQERLSAVERSQIPTILQHKGLLPTGARVQLATGNKLSRILFWLTALPSPLHPRGRKHRPRRD